MPFESLVKLESLLPDLRRCEGTLGAALKHALGNQGSLARARLAYSVASEMELPEQACVHLAAAIEFFHVASLILDDLPCMDDANTRRGQVCVHQLYGESSAILAALALINRAYYLMYQSFSNADQQDAQEANRLADECLGLTGIVNGQALDLTFERTDRSPEMVRLIAQQKTGALFRLCLLLPAIVGGAGRYEKLHLSRLADFWGAAYQAADDLKDVLVAESMTGKTVRQDESLGRPNLALRAGVEATSQELSHLLAEAERSVSSLSGSYPRKWLGVSLFQKEFLAKVEPLLSHEEVA